MIRRLAVSALIAACATALLTSAALAAKPGNAPGAKACQKGGWTSWYTTSGRAFVDEGDCSSYTAMGGILVRGMADVSLTYNANTDLIDVRNDGPLATSLTIEIDATATTGNAIGPIMQGAPDDWDCDQAGTTNLIVCSTASLAAGSSVSFGSGSFHRTAPFVYEVIAAGVTDPDSTPDNGVTTEDDIASLPASPS